MTVSRKNKEEFYYVPLDEFQFKNSINLIVYDHFKLNFKLTIKFRFTLNFWINNVVNFSDFIEITGLGLGDGKIFKHKRLKFKFEPGTIIGKN